MEDIFNTKVQVEITLEELENIILCLRVINQATSGSVRSELEERLSNVAGKIKNNTQYK